MSGVIRRLSYGFALVGALAALFLLVPSVSATTVSVDDSYPFDDPAAHQWTTVQKGVYDAAPGDTVFIFDGTYNENATVHNSSVTIEGQSRTGVVIDRQSLGGAVIRVQADHVTIRNMTLKRGDYGVEAATAAYHNGTVDNVTVLNINWDCIHIYQADDWTIHDTSVSNCGFSGISLQGSGGNAFNHRLWAVEVNVTTSYDGIWAYSVGGLTGSGLTIQDAGRFGFSIWYSAGVRVSEFLVNSSGSHGLYLQSSSGPALDNGSTWNNSGDGLYSNSADYVRLDNVTIENNTNAGVEWWYSSFWTLRSVHNNNARYPYWIYYASPMTLSYFQHDIDQSNTIGGVKVVYFTNATGASYAGPASWVAAVNSSALNISVSNTVEGAQYGVWIMATNGSTFSDLNSSYNDWNFIVERSNNNTFRNWSMGGARTSGGVYLYASHHNLFDGGNWTNTTRGYTALDIGGLSSNNTVSRVNAVGWYTVVYLRQDTADNRVANCTFEAPSYAVRSDYATSLVLEWSTFNGSVYETVYLNGYSGDPIESVNINNNSFNHTLYYYSIGLYLGYVAGGVVDNNTFNDSYYAVYAYATSGVVIEYNQITGARTWGVYGAASDYVQLVGNSIFQNTAGGLYLDQSSYWTMRANNWSNQTVPVQVGIPYNVARSWTTHEADTSNMVNGYPMLWVTNATSGAWNGSYGWVAISNSSNVSVTSTGTTSRNWCGAAAMFTTDSEVHLANSSANQWGACLFVSSRNSLNDSVLTANAGGGIYVWRSDLNRFARDTLRPDFWGQDYGIQFDDTSNNDTVEAVDCEQFYACVRAEYYTNYMTVANSTINNSYYGVSAASQYGPWVLGNLITNTTYEPVYVPGAYGRPTLDLWIANNTLNHSLYYYSSGLYVQYAAGGLVENNTQNDAYIGFYAYATDGTLFQNNFLGVNRVYGFYAIYSSYLRLTSNTFDIGAAGGLYLDQSSFFTLRSNTWPNQTAAIGINMPYNVIVDWTIHDADTSNLVNGLPVLWVVNATGGSWNGSYGWLAASNSSNISLTSTSPVSRNSCGVFFAFVNDSVARNTNSSGNQWGACSYLSNRVSFDDMAFLQNTAGGVYVSRSSFFELLHSTLRPDGYRQDYGVQFDDTSNNGTVESVDCSQFYTCVRAEYNTNWISVLNSTLNDTYYGVYASSQFGPRVERNLMTNSSYDTVTLYGSPGRPTVAYFIANNTINHTTYYYGSALAAYWTDWGRIENNTMNDTYDGVYLYGASAGLIQSNTFGVHLYSAIYGYYSNFVSVVSNAIGQGTPAGIYFDQSRYWTLSSNTIARVPSPVVFGAPDPVTDASLFMHSWSADNTINAEPVRYFVNATGISFAGPAGWLVAVNSTFMDLSSTTVLQTNSWAVLLVDVFNSTVRDTVVNGTVSGVEINGGADNALVNVSVNGSQNYGVYLSNATRTRINGSSFASSTSAYAGIYAVYGSTHLSIADSVLRGQYRAVWSSPNSGFLSLVNCTLEGGYFGVELDQTDDVRIIGNRFEGSYYYSLYAQGYSYDSIDRLYIGFNRVNKTGGYDALLLYYIFSSTIENNTITNTSSAAISLGYSAANTLRGNLLQYAGYGVYLYSSDSNTVSENTLSNDSYVVYLEASADFNAFYHNNFYLSNDQTVDVGTANAYDNGYPSGGNYWSNTTHTDLRGGVSQTTGGPDGINDTAATLRYGKKDSYPLAEPWPPYVTLAGPANNSVVVAGTVLDFNISYYFDTVQYSLNNGTTSDLTFPWDVGTGGLPDGDLFVRVWANDSTGYDLAPTFLWVIDSTRPTIVVDDPPAGATYPPGTQLNFTVSDAHLANNATVDNGTGPVPLAAPWDVSTAGWAEGDYNITIQAWDLAGNNRSATFAYSLDGTPPTIVLNAPANNSFIAAGTTLDFTVTDGHLGAVAWDNGSGLNPLMAPFDISTTGWASGTYTITVTANDTGGLSTTRTFVFTIDAVPPSVVLVAPANNSVFEPGPVLDFEVTDANLAGVTWDTGAGADALAAPFDVDTAGWADGAYDVTITATDTAGNVVVRVFHFEVDSLPPVVSFASPTNGSVVTGGTLLDFSAVDPHLVSVVWTNGSGSSGLIAPYDISTTGWADGTYSVWVNATDALGHKANALLLVTVDSTLPTISQSSPPNGSTVAAGTSLSFAISDANLNASSVGWSNGGPYTEFSTAWEISTSGWADATYTVTVRAADFAGNTRVASFEIKIDSTAPTITLVTPSSGSVVQKGTSIEFSIIDAALANTSYERLSGANTSGPLAFAVNFTIDTAGWADGDYQVIVRASDSAGNVANLTVSITIDSTAPTIAGLAPANGSVIAAGTPLRFSVADPHLTGATWNNGTSGPRSFSVAWEVSTDGWVDRPYNVTITAVDAAGNSAVRVFAFEIDSTPPQVLLLSPANGSWIRAGAIIDFAVSDAHLLNVTASGAPTALSATFDFNTSAWPDGTFALTLSATDAAGNKASVAVTFFVDSTAPRISVAPASGSAFRAGTPLVVTITESNLAMAQWRITPGAFGPFATNFTIDTAAWLDGHVSIEVQAQDKAGNLGSSAWDFDVDTTTPELELVWPVGVTYLRTDVPIDLHIADATRLVTSIFVRGAPFAAIDLGGGLFRLNLSGLGEGALDLDVTVTDAAGNVATLTQVFKVDDTRPVLPSTLPMAYAGNEDRAFTFAGSAADNLAQAGELNFTWRFDSGARTLAQDVLYGNPATFIFTQPGNYSVDLTVSDPAGNANNTTFTITILDITPPNLTVITRFLNATEDVPVSLNQSGAGATDNGLGNLTWFWSVNGTNVTSTGANISWVFPEPGVYNISLRVKDPQNNTAVGSIIVNVSDVTAPQVGILGPAVVDVFIAANFAQNTTDNDRNASPANWNFTWIFSKGSTNLSTIYGQIASFRPSAAGDVAVTLVVRDKSGNVGSKTVILQVNLPPIVISSPPTETNVSSTWSWTPDVIDPERQTVTVSVSAGPSGMAASGGAVTWTPAANQTGPQNVTIAFSDGVTTVYRNFTVFVVDPSRLAGNHAPVFESQPVTDARVKLDYEYTVVVSDADHDVITLTVSGLDGARLDPVTHRLVWSPPWQPGSDETFERLVAVKITAFDTKQSTSQEFVIRFRNPPNVWPHLDGLFSIGDVKLGDVIRVNVAGNWSDRDDFLSNITFVANESNAALRAQIGQVVRWHVEVVDRDRSVLVLEIIGEGSVRFNLSARDPSGGLSDSSLVTVNVRAQVPAQGLPWWLWLVLAMGGGGAAAGVAVALRRSRSAAQVAQTALETAARAPTERVIVQQMPAAAAGPKKDTYLVEGIFVIYQDGRMIYSKTDIGNVKLEDPELVASMFSAVQSFIKDSFQQQGELNRLGFGDNTILIERGSYLFMAAIVYGEPTAELSDALRETIRTIENAYAGVIEDWDGSLDSVAAIDQYLIPLLASTAHLTRADVDQALKEKTVKMLSELEFFQGFVRLKCGVKNDTESVITKVTVSIDFNEDVLRLHHIEPDSYKRQGSEVQMGVLNPGEKVSVAYYFDPQICTESQIDGVARYRDAKGQVHSVSMKPRKAEVVCPIFFTKEHANTAMLKRLVEGELDQRDSKVYTVAARPAPVTWEQLFNLAKEVVLAHDVHMVREFVRDEPYHGEAWFYGETKVKGYKIVIRASLFEDGGTIEFFAASTVIPAITGLLAEFNHTLQALIGRKFSTVQLKAEYSESVKDDLQKKSLMAQMGESELEGGETDQDD